MTIVHPVAGLLAFPPFTVFTLFNDNKERLNTPASAAPAPLTTEEEDLCHVAAAER